MEWLSQNLLGILLVVGLLFLMRRTGIGCGSGHGHHSREKAHRHGDGATITTNPIDLVTKQQVDPQTALTSVYQGQTYYFATRESRDRFEATPREFLSPSTGTTTANQHGSHRGGCC